jgi:peptidoglycan/xylan/chitin deacetylase (PgdA/CDA1 family)
MAIVGCGLLTALLDWFINIPGLLYVLLFLIYVGITSWGALYLSSQFFLPAKVKGDPNSKSVAITFDDGPALHATLRVLEILKQYNAKATFFCIGKNVSAQPYLVKQIHEEGHLVGNHSYFHGSLFDLQPLSKMMTELRNTNTVIHEVIGQEPRFFRPPYGVTNPMLAKAVKHLKLTAIGWSVRSFDTVAKEKDKLLNRVTENLKGGDVILFHDRCELTIAILPDLLKFIKQAGLQVEPLDKLLGEKAYV